MFSARCALIALFALLLCADGASAASWQPATSISSLNSSNSDPAVAVNPRGDSAAVWVRAGNGTLQASTRFAGKPWGQPKPLPDSPVAGAPRVAIDDSGNGVAAWTSQVPGKQPLWVSFSNAGNWSTPDEITASAAEPVVAMNGRSDTVLAWVGSAGIGSSAKASVRQAGGGWSAPFVTKGYPGGMDVHVDAAIDPQGNAIVAWSSDGHVAESVRPAGGDWSDEKPLSSPKEKASPPHVALDRYGKATIVWESSSKAYGYQVIDSVEGSISGGFGAAHEIAFAGNSTAPSLYVGPGGAAVLAWVRDNGAHSVIEAASRAPGAAWGAATVVSNPLKNSSDAHAADGVVVWDEPTIGGNHLLYASDSRTGTWSHQHLVGGPGSGATQPQLASDSGGDAVAVFSRGTAIQAADYDAAPALFGVKTPASGVVGKPLSFSAAGADLWSAVAIEWSFGDGAKAGGSPASHAYAAPGNYTVTVTARDAVGNVSSTKKVVHVGVPPKPPKPGDPPTGSEPQKHTFAGLLLKRQTVVVRKRVARVKATCPAGTVGSCAGTLRLFDGRKVIGRARFTIAAGKSARVRVKVARVAKKGRASARTHDGLGATRTTSVKLKLRRG
jgi:hypothetical protein